MAEIKDPFTPEILQSPAKYAAEVLKAVSALNELIITGQKLIEANAKIATSDETAAKKKQNLTAVEKEAERIRKAQLATHAKLDKARSREVLALQKSKLKLQEVNKEVKNGIVESKRSVLAVEAQKGAYNAISKALSANLIKWKQLTKAERETTEAGKKLTATIKAQRAELAKADKSTGLASRGVGKYKEGVLGAAKSLFGALGLIGGVAGLVKVMSSAIMISLQFEASMAKVRAISGASATEFKALRDQAKFLGEQTQKTAAQAAQLQIELSKIGFSPKQIINSTNAILELSIATGEDLAQSAKVAAGTLKSFNKDAKDAQEITDIMAKSFSSSALDLSKFETAASAAGPTLNAMGITIERMTAQLSILVDRNIDASTAGTGLRNVYLDLNKHGMTLTEALEDINNSSNKANRAFELFGKRGATVAVVLAENQEEADKLTRSYELAAGSAEKMAKIMIDNLKGDTDKATSAMQGLAINLGEQLTPALRSVTQGFTNIVSALSEFAKIGNEELLKEEQLNVNKLAIELTNANTTLLRRNEIYEELQDIAPEVIENIDFENVSIVTLRGNLEKYNQTLIKKLALSDDEIAKSEANKKAGQATTERLNAEDDAQSALNKAREQANDVGGDYKGVIDDIVISSGTYEEKLNLVKNALSAQTKIVDEGKSGLKAYNAIHGAGSLKIAEINGKLQLLNVTKKNEKEATDKASAALKTYTDRYNRIFGTDAVTTGIDEFIQGLIDIEDQLEDTQFDKKFKEFQEQSIKDTLKTVKKNAAVLKKFRDDQTKAQAESSRFEVLLNKDIEAEDKKTDDEFLSRKKALDSELKGLNKSNADFAIKQAKKAADEKIAIERMVKDATVDLTAQGVQAITDLLLEASSQRRDEELERLEEQREEDLELIDEKTQEDLANEDAKVEAGIQTEAQAAERKKAITTASEAEKARIEAETDKKSADIKTKQARAEKVAAIASVGINTAVAIIKAFAQLGPVGGLAATPFIIGAGLLQQAAILATPIPQFADGTHGMFNTPNRFVAGEAGIETIIAPDGSMSLTPNKATLYSDMPNHQIVPAGETKRMLSEMGSKGQSFSVDNSGVISKLSETNKLLRKQSKISHGDNKTYSKYDNNQVTKHESFLNRMKS